MCEDSDLNDDSDDRTSAFLRLLGRYEHSINAYILMLNPNWADAEDLAQETRLRLWKQFDRFEPGTDFGAWARSIAYFMVLSHREKKGRDRLRFGPGFYESIDAAMAVKPDLVSRRQEALTHCMEKLDPSKRATIESYYGGEQSLREFASGQKRSYDATRKAVYRTQMLLADCIESELRGRGGDR